MQTLRLNLQGGKSYMTRKDLVPVTNDRGNPHKTINGLMLLMYILAALFMTLFVLALTVILQ
jgi:hypothetical protein